MGRAATSGGSTGELAKRLKPVPPAPTAAAAQATLEEVEDRWGARYPVISWLWREAWAEVVPYSDYDVEISRVIRSTDVIESPSARFRRAVCARGHVPNEQSAMSKLYLVERCRDRREPGRHHGLLAGSWP